MTIREILDKTKESEIFKLTYNNQILGLRVKRFNVNTCKFEYYDFELDVVKNRDIIAFVKGIVNMKSIPLHQHNNLLMSEAEIHNNLVIQEFEDTAAAEKVLSEIEMIYNQKLNSYVYRINSEGTEDTDRHRVYYTIEIESGKFVDIMCIRDDDWGRDFEYLMDCGDGTSVYDSDQNTYEDFEFDEDKCIALAKEQYEKDYAKYLTPCKLRNLVSKLDIKEENKDKGIDEFYVYEGQSIGISYESENTLIYNIFLGEEYVNISGNGTLQERLPDELARELVDTWNKFIEE